MTTSMFYINSNKTWIDYMILLVSLILFSNAVPLSIPASIFYSGVCALLVCFVFFRENYKAVNIDIKLLVLVVIGFFNLVINDVDPVLAAFPRLALYIVVLMLCSTFIYNRKLGFLRKKLFFKLMWICVFIVAASALFLVLGFVPLHSLNETSGGFQGITGQSMVLGPIACIALLFCLYNYYSHNEGKWGKLLFLLTSGLCCFVIVVTGSRSSLGGVLVGLVAFLFIINGNKVTSVLKFGLILIAISFLTLPLWVKYAEVLIKKDEMSQMNSNVFYSRSSLWNSRIDEFRAHPLFGLGVGNIDLKNTTSGFHSETGTIEAGSSWLLILSSSGLVGFGLFVSLFYTHLRQLIISNKSDPLSALCTSMLLFFMLHMIFEGYIFASGNVLTYLLYLTFSVARYNRHPKTSLA